VTARQIGRNDDPPLLHHMLTMAHMRRLGQVHLPALQRSATYARRASTRATGGWLSMMGALALFLIAFIGLDALVDALARWWVEFMGE
jgi:hypothetical protein